VTAAQPAEPNLADPAFGRSLFLHLAALAAVEGDPARTAEDALHNVLDRERHYWQRTIERLELDEEARRELSATWVTDSAQWVTMTTR
jgi:hypothetical protein